jgi:type II secretory pathway pseudopilin PulG
MIISDTRGFLLVEILLVTSLVAVVLVLGGQMIL